MSAKKSGKLERKLKPALRKELKENTDARMGVDLALEALTRQYAELNCRLAHIWDKIFEEFGVSNCTHRGHYNPKTNTVTITPKISQSEPVQ